MDVKFIDTSDWQILRGHMTTYNPAFDPDNTKARKEYTFQLLEEAIIHFELQKYWPTFNTFGKKKSDG